MRNNFDLISELIDNRLAAISNKAEREQLFFFVFLLQRKKDIEELHKSTHIVIENNCFSSCFCYNAKKILRNYTKVLIS